MSEAQPEQTTEEQISELKATIVSLRARVTELYAQMPEQYQSYQDSQKKVRFLTKCLRQVRYMLALDTCLQATHRERNIALRDYVYRITTWLSLGDVPHSELDDDIPF